MVGRTGSRLLSAWVNSARWVCCPIVISEKSDKPSPSAFHGPISFFLSTHGRTQRDVRLSREVGRHGPSLESWRAMVADGGPEDSSDVSSNLIFPNSIVAFEVRCQFGPVDHPSHPLPRLWLIRGAHTCGRENFRAWPSLVVLCRQIHVVRVGGGMKKSRIFLLLAVVDTSWRFRQGLKTPVRARSCSSRWPTARTL
jgi:hypothetical protein